MTAYKNILKCFVDRTNSNLETIQTLSANGEPPYEVTQLINSLLGLVVLPQQKLFNEIPKTSFDDLRDAGWPVAFLQSSNKKGSAKGNFDDNLNNLLRFFRNGITHFNIRVTEQSGNITGIEVWDKENQRCTSKHWNATLTLDDLRCVIDKFGEIIEEHHS